MVDEGTSKAEQLEVRSIDVTDIPKKVLEVLENTKVRAKNRFGKNVLWEKMTYKQVGAELTETRLMSHSDGLQTYIATWSFTNPERPGIISTYIETVDVFEGKIIGLGQVGHVKPRIGTEPPADLVTDVPYVANMNTEEEFQRKGYAERRYIVMNKLCLEKFGKPLSSGINTQPAARKVWEKLVGRGLARRVRNPQDWPRIGDYVFIA